MSYLIQFNSSKVVSNGYNNTYRHEFPGTSSFLNNAEMAIHSISMYNSVFNIDNTNYSNSTVSIKMPTGTTTQTININFADGLYNYSNMSGYIQKQLESAGAYLIDSDGNYRHYIQLSENATYYACQLDLSPVPTSLPAGWTRPSTGLYSTTGSGLPTTTRVPILVVSNPEFGELIGFSSGEYPSTVQTSLHSILSNIIPQAHPVSTYMIRCSMITNPFSIPSDIFATFDKQGTTAGELISYRPNEYAWIPIASGAYPSMTLTIVDQNQRYVNIRDPNIEIIVAIRQKNN